MSQKYRLAHLPNSISPLTSMRYTKTFSPGNGKLSKVIADITQHAENLFFMFFMFHKCLRCELPICNKCSNCYLRFQGDKLFSDGVFFICVTNQTQYKHKCRSRQPESLFKRFLAVSGPYVGKPTNIACWKQWQDRPKTASSLLSTNKRTVKHATWSNICHL